MKTKTADEKTKPVIQAPMQREDYTEVNKYVGYNDAKCKVDFSTVKAEIRQAQLVPGGYPVLKVVLLTINRFDRRLTLEELHNST